MNWRLDAALLVAVRFVVALLVTVPGLVRVPPGRACVVATLAAATVSGVLPGTLLAFAPACSVPGFRGVRIEIKPAARAMHAASAATPAMRIRLRLV